LNLNGVNQTCAALVSSDRSGNQIDLGHATLAVDGAVDATFDGTISGSGGLVKLGGNTVTLTGTNSYLGQTEIRSGKLRVNSLLGNGAVTVAALSILECHGQIRDSVTIQRGGTLTLGAPPGTLIISNNLTLGGTNVMQINQTRWRRHNDLITGVSTLTYGGVLHVVVSGRPLAPGDSFRLFKAAHYIGAFESIVPPSPGPGLIWDSTGLGVDGTLKVRRALPAIEN